MRAGQILLGGYVHGTRDLPSRLRSRGKPVADTQLTRFWNSRLLGGCTIKSMEQAMPEAEARRCIAEGRPRLAEISAVVARHRGNEKRAKGALLSGRDGSKGEEAVSFEDMTCVP